MTFGDMPEKGMDDPASYFIPGGSILDRDLTKIHPIDLNETHQVQVFIGHAVNESSVGKKQWLHR